MFVVFVIELGTEADADLVAAAVTRSGRGHARLAVARGPVCTVLISRSVVEGVSGLEDNHSLERFTTGFVVALGMGDGRPTS